MFEVRERIEFLYDTGNSSYTKGVSRARVRVGGSESNLWKSLQRSLSVRTGEET